MQVVEQWMQQAQGQWLAYAIWISLGVALGIALLVTLALLRSKRRRRPASVPPPKASTPFLKSSDDNLYFRLDRLDMDGLIIGRGHSVDLRIEESTPNVETVSNQHARIYYDETYGHVIIEDTGSMNGVFINGRQAPHKNLLKDGWVVGLGSVKLTYHDGESDTGPLD